MKGRGGAGEDDDALPPSKKTESKAKPKRVYHTKQQATVIVQSENQRLSSERVQAALAEALKDARQEP